MMFRCTYDHRIIEYGGLGGQHFAEKETGPRRYMISLRSHCQDDQLPAICLLSQSSFHFTRRPHKDSVQWALPLVPH